MNEEHAVRRFRVPACIKPAIDGYNCWMLNCTDVIEWANDDDEGENDCEMRNDEPGPEVIELTDACAKNCELYVADRKAITRASYMYSLGKAFLVRCVYPAALPLVLDRLPPKGS